MTADIQGKTKTNIIAFHSSIEWNADNSGAIVSKVDNVIAATKKDAEADKQQSYVTGQMLKNVGDLEEDETVEFDKFYLAFAGGKKLFLTLHFDRDEIRRAIRLRI